MKMKQEITKHLSHILADTYQLYLKTHGYHWNVRGPQFHSLHTLFMTQYTEMWMALDVIAERIRALGDLAPMSSDAYNGLSSIKDGSPNLKANEMLEDLKVGHERVIATLKAAMDVVSEAGDEPSIDLITQRLATHQKTLWMISASMDED
jgi:starvation-inducible DNA-binding protein